MIDILLITNKSDITSDFVVNKIREKSLSFYRLNTEEVGENVTVSLNFSSGRYVLFDKLLSKEIDLNKVRSVYYRRPEIKSFTHEDNLTNSEILYVKGEILYTLEGIYKVLNKCNWVSPLYSIRQAENKVYQLLIAKEIGFNIPNSLITSSFVSAQNFFIENLNDCIVKPIKNGLVEESEKVKVVYTSSVSDIEGKAEQISFCPTFFQNKIHKKYDVRVTVVGNRLFPVSIDSQNNDLTIIDWRKGNMILPHKLITLPIDIEEKCFDIVNKLGLKFGAIDLIQDENDNYIFLEINPNGQWAWIENRLGCDISGSIVNLLCNVDT